MHSTTARDAMNTRVSEAFEKWPSFEAMPVTKNQIHQSEGPAFVRRVAVSGDPDEQENYVKALFACCSDSIPIGRDGAAIVGKRVDDDNEAAQWATVKRTQAIVKDGMPLIDDAPTGRRLKTS